MLFYLTKLEVRFIIKMVILLKNTILKLIFSAVALILTYIIKIEVLNFILTVFAAIVLLEETIRELIQSFKDRKIKIKDLIFVLLLTLLIIFRLEKEVLVYLLFYILNEYIIDKFLNKNKENIINELDYSKKKIHLKTVSGMVEAKWEDIKEGDIFYLGKGEKLCVDAICVSDNAFYYAANTDIYKQIVKDEDVLSGTILNSDCYLKAKTNYKNSIYTKMLDKMKQTDDTKSIKFLKQIENKYLSLIMMILLVIAFIMLFIFKMNLKIVIIRLLNASIFLTFTNLSIFISFCYFSYLYNCKKKEIYFLNSNLLEKLKKIKTAIFSKTGVLTKEEYDLMRVIPVYVTKEEVLRYAAHAENGSNHRMAKAILKVYNKPLDLDKIYFTEDIKGLGRRAIIEGKEIYIGTRQLFDNLKITYPKVDFLTPTCMISVDGTYVGTLVFNEELRESAYLTTSLLKEQGIDKIVLISASETEQIKKIGNRLSMNESYALLNLNEKEEVIKMYSKDNDAMYIDAFSINDNLKQNAAISVVYKGTDGDITLLDDNLQNLAFLKQIINDFSKYGLIFLISYFGLKLIFGLLGILGICALDTLMIIEFIYTFIISNLLLRRLR